MEFAAYDQAGAVGPGVEVDEPGDLDDLSAVAILAVAVAGWRPAVIGNTEEGVADPAVDLVSDREAEVAVSAILR